MYHAIYHIRSEAGTRIDVPVGEGESLLRLALSLRAQADVLNGSLTIPLPGRGRLVYLPGRRTWVFRPGRQR